MAARDSTFHEIRSRGIGGSEVAAILGLDPNRDKFSVYADKLGLITRAAPNSRMRWGKLLEQAIAQGYAEQTGYTVDWCDLTTCHPDRPWQLYTPDAWVWEDRTNRGQPDGGLDAKNVGWDQAYKWGEPGGDDIPVNLALQMQWYCSAANKNWWDVAALFGGNDLRIYRIHRDSEIEQTCLAECDLFWREHVLARKPPEIGSSPAASQYLKERFPRNVQPLAIANEHECMLMNDLRRMSQRWDEIDRRCAAAENAIKLQIGDREGLIDGKSKVTYRKSKDTTGVDWQMIARHLLMRLEGNERAQIIEAHTGTLKAGSRRLHTSWGKARTEWQTEQK